MNTQQPQQDFTSDGFSQPLYLLNSPSLEYAGKSLAELQELMLQNIALEKYEACALIRDEIDKRKPALSYAEG